MYEIRDSLLIESYKKAVKFEQIDETFIAILKQELEKRGIPL
ncbi:sporulation histidine kinase inhibitor Sda [Desertibacillus haloalkaliphilus]|nr:sporulation histidine kinase inhibitor Sda [Desertibacillus haloalkaliphilus]MBU8905388.1 sporulation histidine kinase inhibitor Sda [Desertibacillus haloalkaliphilus]